mgnify:CR=1 FL=1
MTDEQKFREAIKKLKTGKKLSYQEAIDLKCLDCMCYQIGEVEQCIDDECVNFYYKSRNQIKSLKERLENIAKISQ